MTYYINAQEAYPHTSGKPQRFCVGRYNSKAEAEKVLPKVKATYKAYTRFTINTKPKV